MPGTPFDPIAEARRQWVAHWGDAAVPSMSAVTSVMRVQQILMTRLNRLLKPYGLTFPRYEALMILRVSRRGALPLGKVGARLQVHPTSVTNLIDGLERDGLVRREAHAQDRRATLAIITERGRGVADAATDMLNAARFGTAPLEEGDLETISDILRALRADEDGFAVA
jgi:DNA-binding MarR family transcriptional regulator